MNTAPFNVNADVLPLDGRTEDIRQRLAAGYSLDDVLGPRDAQSPSVA
ncbi:hypothetical protein [Nocardioides sp. R-C-SC26]|nr:hypothetical protein [Nocardioides sp. R-C-SC26]